MLAIKGLAWRLARWLARQSGMSLDKLKGEEALRLLAESSGDVIFRFDSNGRLRYVSPSVEALYGFTPEQMFETPGDINENPFTHPADRAAIREAVRRHLAGEIDRVKLEFRILHAEGHAIWVETHCNAVRDDRSGAITDLILTMRDMSEKKRFEDELRCRALTDGLTGIGNRRAFEERLTSEWDEAAATGMPLALVMIDIDHFKTFNDEHGHLAGDDCLRVVAETIASAVPQDAFTARFGGEEFAVILPGANRSHALSVAKSIRTSTGDAGKRPDTALCGRNVTISLGVAACWPRAGEGGRSKLLAAADAALYEAKRSGRDRAVAAPDVPPAPLQAAG